MGSARERTAKIGVVVSLVSVGVFASALFLNHVLDNAFIGDLFELTGTAGIVTGGCIIVSALSQKRYIIGGFIAASCSLIFARLVDYTEEFSFLLNTPVFGRNGYAHSEVRFFAEGLGYSFVFVNMLALLLELVKLKNVAEENHRRYREVHEASLFLARVADMSAEAVIGSDRDGRIRTWNKGAEALFGFAAEEATGLQLRDIIVEGLQDMSQSIVGTVTKLGALVDIDVVGRTKKGKQFPASASFSLVSHEENKPVGMSVVIHDIERRKQVERELIASRNLLTGALQNADVGMFVLGKEASILEYNTRMVELTGIDPTGRDLESHFATLADPAVAFCENIRELVFLQGKTAEFRNLVVHRESGEKRVCNIAVTPVLDEQENVVAAVGIAVDNTEREALQAKLLEVQKMEGIGRLAGGVAHDFNNILSGILGYASLMSTKLEPDSEFRRYVHVIEESASRAAELTKQLLAFAREDGVSRMQVDLNRVVDESLKLVSSGLDPNIQLEFHPGEGVHPIHADAGQLQQLVTNLCINSRDALPGKGIINVRTANAEIDEAAALRLNVDVMGPYVQLTVADDGCGMPPEITQRMFEPFFSTKQDGQAYGLGLSVVYGIVNRHKGAIHVESQQKQGTEIHVYFPAVTTALAASEESVVPAAPPARGSETVLVVDDEELVRAVVGDILTTAGYTVLEATTGEEAIEVYQERQGVIDLVVLDLIMPGMGGIRALEELRKLAPDIRCILNSGHTTQTIDTRKLTGKHVRFMPKPFQAGILTTAVRDVLDA